MDKKITKVVDGKVTVKKTPAYKKLAQSFIQEDSKTIWDYFFNNIFIPALKKGAEELLHVALYGANSGGKRPDYGYSPRSSVSYKSYYPEKDKEIKRNYSNAKYDDLTFNTRDDAEKVLMCMDELVDTYGYVNLQEYYRLSGVPEENIAYTYRNYGWKDIHTANVEMLGPEEYIINLPRPLPL